MGRDINPYTDIIPSGAHPAISGDRKYMYIFSIYKIKSLIAINDVFRRPAFSGCVGSGLTAELAPAHQSDHIGFLKFLLGPILSELLAF